MKNLIATLLIAASIGLFYVFLDPTYKEIQALRLTKTEYDEAINNSQKILESRDKILNKYNGFELNNLKRLEKLLPNHVDNIRLIIEADDIAARHNMILKNVKISTEKEGAIDIPQDLSNTALPAADPYGTAEFTFDVSGSYTAYRSFLRDIEKNLRLMDIIGISLSVKKEDKNDGGGEIKRPSNVYTFTTSVRTYWLK